MSRFRLYPTREQEGLLLAQCAHARYVWNLGLEQRLMWRRWQGPTPNLNEQTAQLTEARNAEPWLRTGSVNVQQQALRDLDHSWRFFLAGTHGKPTWRKKGGREGFRLTGRNFRVRQDNDRWSSLLVAKVGWVKFRRSCVLPEFKSCRVVRCRDGRWYVCFAVLPKPVPAPGAGEVVGVDRGVAVAVMLSTGEFTSPPRTPQGEAERMIRLQRRLRRAQPGSRRGETLRLQYARMHARVAARRKDWTEKTTTDLARRFDVIRLEDLNVAGMAKSSRIRAGGSGLMVRQKSGLNRGIYAANWSEVLTRLRHKAPGRVEIVNPAYTSQTCNACKVVDSKSRKSQARFECTACGHQANADVNAARNIRDKEPAVGRTVAARGDSGLTGSVKREPRLCPAA